MGGVANNWYQRVQFFKRRHIKFYHEDTLQNPKMYTQANKYKNMYLTSAKTENLSTNFVKIICHLKVDSRVGWPDVFQMF